MMYAICVVMLGCEMGDSVSVALLGLVFMTNPNKSSFSENLSAGSSHQFRILIVSSKWSGQFLGKLSIDILSMSSLSRFGVQSRLSMWRKSLFVPLTRPFTHGKYVGAT